MPLRRVVGIPPRRTGPAGPASSVGPDRARTPRRFGAGLLLRGFQGGDVLWQRLGTIPGVVVVRGDGGSRTHKQPCGTHPPLGRAVAEERLWLPERGGMPLRGANADRDPDATVAEASGAGLPVSRNRGSSGRPSRSATTGPSGGLNGYSGSTPPRGSPRSPTPANACATPPPTRPHGSPCWPPCPTSSRSNGGSTAPWPGTGPKPGAGAVNAG